MLSTDLATIAFSTNAFEKLKANNEVYRNYLGAKTYDELVKKEN